PPSAAFVPLVSRRLDPRLYYLLRPARVGGQPDDAPALPRASIGAGGQRVPGGGKSCSSRGGCGRETRGRTERSRGSRPTSARRRGRQRREGGQIGSGAGCLRICSWRSALENVTKLRGW